MLHWSPSEVDDEEQANGNAVKADEKERMKEGETARLLSAPRCRPADEIKTRKEDSAGAGLLSLRFTGNR